MFNPALASPISVFTRSIPVAEIENTITNLVPAVIFIASALFIPLADAPAVIIPENAGAKSTNAPDISLKTVLFAGALYTCALTVILLVNSDNPTVT